jgi:hypothetical protein
VKYNGILDTIIKVHPRQFHGIEIDEFAAQIANTAMWIKDQQMNDKATRVLSCLEGYNLKRLPIGKSEIVTGNALACTWKIALQEQCKSCSNANECLTEDGSLPIKYIIGNPPYKGYYEISRDPQAVSDMRKALIHPSGHTISAAGSLDYCTGWLFKTAELLNSYANNQSIKTAFILTRGVIGAEHANWLWEPLEEGYGLDRDFAYDSFPFAQEMGSTVVNTTSVQVVIIGFSKKSSDVKLFYADPNMLQPQEVDYISRWCTIDRSAGISRKTDAKDRISPVTNPLKAGSPSWFKGYEKDKKMTDAIYAGLTPAQQALYCQVIDGFNLTQDTHSYFKRDTINSSMKNTLKSAMKDVNNRYIAIPQGVGDDYVRLPARYVDPHIVPKLEVKYIIDGPEWQLGILISRLYMLWVHKFCTPSSTTNVYAYMQGSGYSNFPFIKPSKTNIPAITQVVNEILRIRASLNKPLSKLYRGGINDVTLANTHGVLDDLIFDLYNIPHDADDVAILDHLYDWHFAIKADPNKQYQK